MKTLKNIRVIVLIICLLACMLIPLLFWIKNPDLTEIQIFIKFWPLYLLSTIDTLLLVKFLK